MRARYVIPLVLTSWFFVGMIAGGWAFTHFQRTHPQNAEESYKSNRAMFWWGVGGGGVSFITVLINGGNDQGFLIPGAAAWEEAKRLQAEARKPRLNSLIKQRCGAKDISCSLATMESYIVTFGSIDN